MSEISKERVEALASNILECHDAKPSEVKALAVLALPALRERAEPVTVSLKLAKLFRKITNSEIDAEGNAHVILSPNETLTIIEARIALTAPPEPVVPAETFEEWSRRCEIQLTLCRPEFREVAEITWNACCAAMIAAPSKEG
ncbi:hypothetical protein [Cronobacter dublinensis]|uniref:hypothetical protein n=1 Tax=Cronobacter dublinensis TaxID=413497 RepID=UPI000D00E5A6|nr:hypothetical protein [Cronobacter dublinensis]